MSRQRSSKAAAAQQAISVLPWNPPPLIINPSRVPGSHFIALFCSRPRISSDTVLLIGVSCSRRFTWVAVRCRSCSAFALGLRAWYSASDRRGAGMKDPRDCRHRCHPSQVVRSGGGPARRNDTNGLSPLLSWSSVLGRATALLIVVGQDEH